jgi:hypothetical protein
MVSNVKKKLVVLGGAAVAALLGAIYLWGPGNVPAGQQPMVTLSPAGIQAFEAAFDSDASMPRLVLLVSPT